MTKEEYLTIVDRETDRLSEEERALVNKLAFYKKMGNTDKEMEEIQYKIDIIHGKLFRLKNLAKVEAKIRIQAMNDELLKDYQDEKIKELEDEIKDLKQDIADREETIRINEQAIEQLASSGSLSDEYIAKAKIKKETIQRITYEIRDINKKIAEKTKELQELQSKNLEQVREMLLEKTESKVDVDYLIDLGEKDGLSILDGDSSKTRELAGLRREYIYNEELYRKFKMDQNYYISQLPKSIAMAIRDAFNQRNPESPYVTVDDPEKLIQIIEEHQNVFSQNEALFYTLYDINDIAPLMWKSRTDNIDPYNVDLEILRYHINAVGNKEYATLKEKIEQRDALEKKFIKTKNTKAQIEDYNQEIAEIVRRMYEKITTKYQKIVDFGYFQTSADYYGNRDVQLLDFDGSLEHNKYVLKDVHENIQLEKNVINNVYQQALKHKEELDRRKGQYKKDMDDTLEKIAGITGKKETVYQGEDQLQHAIDQTTLGYQTDLLKQIREEAQKQVEMETERLRQIQSLKEQREQLVGQNQENSNKTDEEVRHY